MARCGMRIVQVLLIVLLCRGSSALANSSIYSQILPSTVWVNAGDSTGTGFLVDASRKLVVTNYHVVHNDTRVRVFFPDFLNGRAINRRSHYLQDTEQLGIRGRVVYKDSSCDLALIALVRVPASAKAIPLIDRAPQPGGRVHSIGNPGGQLWSYHAGYVSNVYPGTIRYDNNQTVKAMVVETNLDTNPGDSGGPVVNDDGELVGIHSGCRRNARGVTFSIDASELQTLLSRDIDTNPTMPYAVVTLYNDTGRGLTFSYRWSPSASWQSGKLAPWSSRYYWLELNGNERSSRPLYIRFDNDLSSKLHWEQHKIETYRADAEGDPRFEQGAPFRFVERSGNVTLRSGPYFGSRRPYAVIGFRNDCDIPVNFSFRWSVCSNWQERRLAPGKTRYWWRLLTGKDRPMPQGVVRFDSDLTDDLLWRERSLPPKRIIAESDPGYSDAKQYQFTKRSSKTLDLRPG